MIIDTSALIAILRAEDDASDMALAIERAQVRKISAANYLETAVVIDASRDPVARPQAKLTQPVYKLVHPGEHVTSGMLGSVRFDDS